MKNKVTKSIINFLSPGIIQFSLVIFFLIFILLYQLFNLPTANELIQIASKLYSKNGVIVLLIAATVEGIFMINIYFPGSLVILVGVIVSNGSISEYITIGYLSLIGFLFSVLINYALGRFGFYKALLILGKNKTLNRMENYFSKWGMWTIFLTSFHPNFLAFSVVSCGIAKMNLLRIMAWACISLSFWITLWIIVFAPLVKKIDFTDNKQGYYFCLIIFIWGLLNCLIAQNKKSITH